MLFLLKIATQIRHFQKTTLMPMYEFHFFMNSHYLR